MQPKHPLHVDQFNAITYPAHIAIAMMEDLSLMCIALHFQPLLAMKMV